MKWRILIVSVLLGAIAAAGISGRKTDGFSSADDFPRDALVYVQVADVPALIKLLRESDAAAKYLKSRNFEEFKNRHLGLKLASRWQEFNDGAGFSFDFDTISGFAQNRAALAIYDIGKLEFVFIAPVSDEIFAATMLMQNSARFNTEEIDGLPTIYRIAVDADRGRQKQELLFTNVKGRLIIATSERLLARTILNVTGRSNKDRLSDDPTFRRLSNAIEPHEAAIWLNQAALNNDYYFKRYWLMGNVTDLKNLRAVISDLSFEEGKIVEHREFLLKERPNVEMISSTDAAKALSKVPENIPFVRLRGATPSVVADAINVTIGGSQSDAQKLKKPKIYRFSGDFGYDSGYDDYTYLGSKFDETIDEDPDDETNSRMLVTIDSPSRLFDSASPQNVLTLVRPEILTDPLFVEFRRGAVFRMGSPSSFDEDRFESAIGERLKKQVTVTAANIKLKWETKMDGEIKWRELEFPALGRSVCYLVRKNELFITNDRKFLSEMVNAKSMVTEAWPRSGLTEYTVLLAPETKDVYDKLFRKLAGGNTPDDFFTGNIKSLIESASGIKKIEFERNYSQDLAHEKIIFYLK